MPHKKFSVVHPDPLRGAVVAAGGNANENLSDGAVDFAQRSIRHKDTIAVMNINDAGIACTSATVALADLPHAFVVAFDGRVGPNDCDDSGTSFAAPRIAWLFAAGEAIRKTSLPHASWGNRQHDYIKTLRNPANALLGTRLDPVAFLKGIAALP